jgi:polyisoprenoid-binding protein YceI
MKKMLINVRTLCMTMAILPGSLFVCTHSNGQVKYQSSGDVKISIEGTSNIHDWKMQSDKGTFTGVFEISNSGLLTSIADLRFSMPAESLKSEHKAMDKNTYKALNTGKYASISFTAGAAEIKRVDNFRHVLTIRGKLTISGVTRDILLIANAVVNGDKSISYTGSHQLTMTDYNIEPPSAMLGSIKTGDKVVIRFNGVVKAK